MIWRLASYSDAGRFGTYLEREREREGRMIKGKQREKGRGRLGTLPIIPIRPFTL
jgi:hypothetical protein